MMKIKIFTALSLISGLAFFQGQKLEFKDKNLEKTVLQNLDLNKDGIMDLSEAEKVTNLFLVQKDIKSVEDLHFFKNVKMIMMDDNAIPIITLKDLDKLQLFSCTGCKATAFKAENLRSLASLYMDNNLLESFSLKETPRIDQLTVSLNKLKAIDVSQLKNLRKLNIEHNAIQKIDISGNPILQTVNVDGNKMKDIDIKKGTKTDVTIFGTEQ